MNRWVAMLTWPALLGCPANDPGWESYVDTGLWQPGGAASGTASGDSGFELPFDSGWQSTDTDTDTGTGTGTGGTPTSPVITDPKDVSVVYGEEIVCADPTVRDTDGPLVEHLAGSPPELAPDLIGSGVVVADLNGDDYADILWAGRMGGRLLLSQGKPGIYSDEATRLADVSVLETVGGSAADFDADGDLDLLLLRDGLPCMMLVNDGQGRFLDAAVGTGVAAVNTRASSSTWFDWDGDGDLDLFVSGYGDGPEIREPADRRPSDSYLMENQGGYFEELDLPDLVQDGYVLSARFAPISGNPLLLANDLLLSGPPGGAFPAPLFDRDPDGWLVSRDLTAVELVELNGDGIPDVLTAGTDVILYQPGEEGSEGIRWRDSLADELFLEPDISELRQRNPWSIQAVDVDLDGTDELWVVYGEFTSGASNQTDALFQFGLSGEYVDVAGAWGLDVIEAGRGAIAADIDGNGYPDLVRNDLGATDFWYTQRCGANHWLTVRPRQLDTANTFSVGARVQIEVGGVLQTDWIKAGTGFASGGPPEVGFGIGSAEVVDSLTIQWPDGTTHRWTEVPVDRVVTLFRD